MAAVQKPCGKCSKIVYPTEEIKCLDKHWHKACFKCTTCGMTLSVKNVKGYDKMPYCNVHYPQPKPTVVTDNPEMQRIKQLTDIQSNVKYHEDFNKNKGKFTAVTDDPAMTQAKKHQQVVSQAEYTGKRKDSAGAGLLHALGATSNSDVRGTYHHNQNQNPQPNGSVPGILGFRANHIPPSSAVMNHNLPSDHSVGRVADYDPLNDDRGSLARGYEPTSKGLHATKFEPNNKGVSATVALTGNNPLHMVLPSTSTLSSASTSDSYSSYSVENGNGRHVAPSSSSSSQAAPYSYTANTNFHRQHDDEDEEEEQQQKSQQHDYVSSHGDGHRHQLNVRALYNYTATEGDEISFEEGDTIVECEVIDAGWMLGRHPKTNKQGLLPSNYVEILN